MKKAFGMNKRKRKMSNGAGGREGKVEGGGGVGGGGERKCTFHYTKI